MKDKPKSLFSNQFFRVEGRMGSALPFLVGENNKPKFPLYCTRMIQSPKPPQCSSLSPSEKEPLQCAFYFPLNTKISPLHVPNSKQVVEVYPEQRKNQQVLVENSPTPTPPLLPPPETDHLCGFEGDGAGLPSCVQGHALDSNGLISHSMGHMDLCSFLQGLFQQGIMGVNLFVEKMEVIRKQVSELESELNEERSARKKAEGKVAEMEKELASARRDCDKMDSYYHHESKRLLEA